MSIEVIVAFAVAEQAEETGWNKLVNLVCSEPDPEAALKNAEAEWKEKFEGKPLPPTYRSNKSVALKARKLGVLLVGDNGEPKGKSAVEQECKELVAASRDPEHWSVVVGRLIGKLNAVYGTLGDDDAVAYIASLKVNLKGL